MNLATNLRQRGDTIVEVVIAAALVGLVLVSSFSIANRSSQGIRDAAEHDEAQKIAQGAMEGLQSWVDARPNLLSDPSVPLFCRDGSNAATHSSGVAATTRVELDAPDVTKNDGGNCKEGQYRIFFERPDSARPDVFVVYVIWDRLGGGISQLSYVYKVVGA